MLLPTRSIAVSAAVICFFTLSIVSSAEGLPSFTCCKRALLGATITYIGIGMAVRSVNAILTQAMIASHINKEYAGDSQEQ